MEERESSTESTFHQVLFATDFSPASDAAFNYAATIANRYRAQLHVAHVINAEPFDLIAPESSSSVIRQAHEQARRKIEDMLLTHGFTSDRYHIIVALKTTGMSPYLQYSGAAPRPFALPELFGTTNA